MVTMIMNNLKNKCPEIQEKKHIISNHSYSMNLYDYEYTKYLNTALRRKRGK